MVIKNICFVESFTSRLPMRSNVILFERPFEQASKFCLRMFYNLCSVFFHIANCTEMLAQCLWKSPWLCLLKSQSSLSLRKRSSLFSDLFEDIKLFFKLTLEPFLDGNYLFSENGNSRELTHFQPLCFPQLDRQIPAS